ncbi:hypothetical protein [Alkalimarinus alittae]|uniref:Uncharacterized protein n=1 Tax=Alkalimarinus alittae TaxID=2961619 RepID=A0ABY6N320_9ALTE|nr:hypothetical protein [Alkalimarinus alittae]UZE96445.1 hypothetical protein NKI27_01480 [Alkalimarinus alittae]
MHVNSSNFARTYQSIKQTQQINEKLTALTTEQKSKQHLVQSEPTQNKSAVIVNIVDYKQTQHNLDTYIQSYQNAANTNSNTHASEPSYQEIQDINQTISRHNAASSRQLRDLIEQVQALPIPTPYYQVEPKNLIQTGSMINTFA